MRWLVALFVVAWLTPAALADDKPWAQGVSEADQKAALELYKQGNASFEQSEYKAALEKYTQALAKWDHPAVRYNAAVCLFNLDRPVEAYEYLVAALRFGEPPLGKDLFAQANNYMKLLSSQVGELEVRCAQDHAKVTLDGQPLVDCPNKASRHLLAKDPHQLVAIKDGYKTETREVRIAPGKTSTLVIELHPVESAGHLVRRMPRWLPWAIGATGVAVAAVGVPFWSKGSSGYSDYDNACRTAANDNGRSYCFQSELSASVVSARNDAPGNIHIAAGAFIAGGAIFATGVALVIWNSPHLERAPVVAPSVGPDHAGVTVVGRW